MALSTQRAEADPGIAVNHWDIRHNILADGPERVLNLLRNLPNYAGTTTQQPGQPGPTDLTCTSARHTVSTWSP